MNYNKIEKYKELQIPSDYVVIESLNIKEDPDNPGYRIAPQERITPQKELFYNSQAHLIACVTSTYKNIDGTETIILDNDMHFTKYNGWRIILRKGVPQDEKRYKFIMLSPQNQNNVLGLSSEPYLFRVVDANKDAEALLNKKKEELEFNQKIITLPDGIAKEIAKTLGVSEDNANTARSRLLTLAEHNIGALKEAILSYEAKALRPAPVEPTDRLGTIKRAFELKKIDFDKEKSVVHLTGRGRKTIYESLDEDGSPKPLVLEDMAYEIEDDGYESLLQAFKVR